MLAEKSNRKYGSLKLLYSDSIGDFALIEVISPMQQDAFHSCIYFDKLNHRRRLVKIKLSIIVSFGVEIPSIDTRHPNRVNIS